MEQRVLDALAINRTISYSKSGEYRARQLQIKQELINEAVSWPGDPIEGQFIFTKVWENGNFSVQFGKYGKEYYRTERRNINDMFPAVFENGEINEFDASFRAIFRLVENLYINHDNEAILVLACLFIRNAFLVDHERINGNFRYNPPQVAIDFLEQRIGSHHGVPMSAFMQYIDAIAWQEDVKYTTLGKKITNDVGRTNNMLTYARFCACLLGRSSYAEMLNKYSMGVSALPKNEIAQTFPELKTSY